MVELNGRSVQAGLVAFVNQQPAEKHHPYSRPRRSGVDSAANNRRIVPVLWFFCPTAAFA